MRVRGVILAAGTSTRLGRPKQLLTLDGDPIVRLVARNAVAARLSDVIAVTGHESAAVAAAVSGLPVRCVENERYRLGQSMSLKAGLAAVADDADAVVFLLGDQPEVDAGVIDGLIERFERTRAPIVQPVYGSTPGNPVLFARPLFPELEQIAGDEGARSVIKRHAGEVERVVFLDRDVPGDVDTEADYDAMTARWRERTEERR